VWIGWSGTSPRVETAIPATYPFLGLFFASVQGTGSMTGLEVSAGYDERRAREFPGRAVRVRIGSF
jgi:hypothetical protein